MNKKKVLGLFIKFIIGILLITVFVIVNDQITENKLKKFKPVEDSLFYTYEVESARVEGTELVIKGWFFEVGKFRNDNHERTDNKRLGVMLYDIDSEKSEKEDGLYEGIKLEVTHEKRYDVNEYFECEYDYSDCGFVAKVDSSRVDMVNGNYQIIFKQDESNYPGIMSNSFLCQGKLEFVSPKVKTEVDVNGTDLDPIINEGICLLNNPDKHIWVYQYKWTLYWITENGYEFGENDKTYIQYQLDTTQFERLPKERIDNKQYWSNIGFHFEKNEITEQINCGKYRVSICGIPEDYSVTRILTGYNKSGEWKWMDYIRPRYIFD